MIIQLNETKKSSQMIHVKDETQLEKKKKLHVYSMIKTNIRQGILTSSCIYLQHPHKIRALSSIASYQIS